MSARTPRREMTRRDMLIGAGAALAASPALGAVNQPAGSRAARFDVGSFVADCIRANTATIDAQAAVREVLARAMNDPASVLAGVGEPQEGGLRAIHRSENLTILNIVWAPLMQLLPHDHAMWALIGIYTGREDNIFWTRRDARIAATGARDIERGDVIALPADVIHSVANPIGKLTGAIHIYGGDFFAGGRTEWDPETLVGRPWSIQGAVRQFRDANDRFFGPRAAGHCA